jgi:hypothetical protein
MYDYPHIIISSAPRSGSTALAKLLGQQRDLFVMNEIGVYDDWDNVNKWCNFIHTKEWINFVANEKIFGAHGLDLYEFREIVMAQKMSGRDIFEWLFNNVNVSLIGDKCPITYINNMLVFANKFPNAKFVIVIRDGRDVVASQIRGYHRWPPGSPDHANHWMKATVQEAQGLWLNVSRAILQRINQIDKNRLYVFRYEDAIKDMDLFCLDLSKFLGVNITNVDGFFKSTNVGKWVDEHPNMMDGLSYEFRNMLSEFGYL